MIHIIGLNKLGGLMIKFYPLKKDFIKTQLFTPIR